MMNALRVKSLILLMGLSLLGAGCGADTSGGDFAAAGPGASSDTSSETQNPEPGQLTAGEWNDRENWTFWLDLCDEESGVEFDRFSDAWSIDVRTRYAVEVTTPDGEPAVDVPVRLEYAGGGELWRTRTDNHGRADLYSLPFAGGEPVDARIVAGAEGAAATIEEPEPTVEGGRADLELDQVTVAPESLDLMLVIDTTGSMSDELSYLQSELEDVVKRTRGVGEKQLDVRLSVNFYRDSGDAYTVRSNPFTSDIDKATSTLAAQSANGGGDYPEAVQAGLEDAIEDHEWSSSARARLLFLVLDAPPHEGDQVRESLHRSIRLAAEKGVRIIPLAASGTDRNTEYVLRASSILTGGTYTFLTDHSGIGNDHLEPSVGEFEVEYLNDLMVRIIGEYTQ